MNAKHVAHHAQGMLESLPFQPMLPRTTAATILPPKLTVSDVLSKANYFTDVQLWPLQFKFNPEGWLNNFLDSEQQHAIYLLNGFMYFSSYLMDQMLVSSFQSLSSTLYAPGDSFLTLQAKWRLFVDTVIITYVTGETPNPTDSGVSFARRARQSLRIDQAMIMEPDEAVRTLVRQPGPVVFVDDFVGSGNQFITTWRRPVQLSTGPFTSFERLCAIRGTEFYYCPLLCTEYGFQRLQSSCSAVHVCPAHVLSPMYSALDPSSILWPTHLQPTAVDFVRNASLRAGIVEWSGFHNLGLAVALGDSIPDATLPIFYWNRNSWRPLMERI